LAEALNEYEQEGKKLQEGRMVLDLNKLPK
jgi:hypothetical protein